MEHLRPEILPETIKVQIQKHPSLNAEQIKSLRILSLTEEQLLLSKGEEEIKAAYRKSALKHHPDRGGKHEDMVAINEATKILFEYARNPKTRQRRLKSITNSWYFDGEKNKWWPQFNTYFIIYLISFSFLINLFQICTIGINRVGSNN